MMKYGLPLLDSFPRRNRKLADILRESLMDMYRLATQLEKSYYKKNTLQNLDVELAVVQRRDSEIFDGKTTSRLEQQDTDQARGQTRD